jgi:hypothetical protein
MHSTEVGSLHERDGNRWPLNIDSCEETTAVTTKRVESWLELVALGYDQVLAGTAWDTPGPFGGFLEVVLKAAECPQAIDEHGFGGGAGGRN